MTRVILKKVPICLLKENLTTQWLSLTREILNRNQQQVWQDEEGMQDTKKIMIEVRTSVDEKIDKLADKVEDKTSKVANFKEEVNGMKKRIHELEIWENVMVDAVEKKVKGER